MNSEQKQKFIKEWLPIVGVILALLIMAWLLWPSEKDDGNGNEVSSSINSFEECEEAGFPIMESHPRRCRAEDGELYTEDVEAEIGAQYEEFTSEEGQIVKIAHPVSGDEITSPLEVAGEVTGAWTREPELYMELMDSDNNTIATDSGLLEVTLLEEDEDGDSYVRFEAEMQFEDEDLSGRGFLILGIEDADSESEEVELVDSIVIPVNFSSDSPIGDENE